MGSADNAFIQSVKWILKWIGLTIAGLIVLVLVGVGIAFG